VQEDQYNEVRRVTFNDAFQLNLGAIEEEEKEKSSNVAMY
jgi:hypothetical protein